MDWIKTMLVLEWINATSNRYMSYSTFGYVRLIREGNCWEGNWIV